MILIVSVSKFSFLETWQAFLEQTVISETPFVPSLFFFSFSLMQLFATVNEQWQNMTFRINPEILELSDDEQTKAERFGLQVRESLTLV